MCVSYRLPSLFYWTVLRTFSTFVNDPSSVEDDDATNHFSGFGRRLDLGRSVGDDVDALRRPTHPRVRRADLRGQLRHSRLQDLATRDHDGRRWKLGVPGLKFFLSNLIFLKFQVFKSMIDLVGSRLKSFLFKFITKIPSF